MYIYVYTHIFEHACICVRRLYVHMYTYMYICIHICIYMCVNEYTHVGMPFILSTRLLWQQDIVTSSHRTPLQRGATHRATLCRTATGVP